MTIPPRLLPALALVLSATACDPFGSTGPASRFPEPRFYAHDLFPSEEACLAAQRESGTWFNCFQSVAFCPDGHAELMVTDIVHLGRYEARGGTVVLRVRANPEVPETVRFALAEDGGSLTDPGGGVWTLREGPEADAWSRGCEEAG